MINRNGLILWEGPSRLDGSPIVVIATGLTTVTRNAKTGDMVQTYILQQDTHPLDSFQTDAGAAICGHCTHHGTEQATCYVNWGQGPAMVWKCYKNPETGYAKLEGSALGVPGLVCRHIRFGSAGDPAMVPASVWIDLAQASSGWTGYTHQWREPWAADLQGICQASCDSFADYLEASSKGWQCYLVSKEKPAKGSGLIHCGASKERGKVTDCQTCGLCDGQTADVWIMPHGKKAAKFNPTGALAHA